MQTMTDTLLEYVALGGVVMVPILLCAVLALAIVFDRLWNLRRKRWFQVDLLETVEHLLQEQELPEATTLCKRHDSLMTRLILVALLNADRPRWEIKELIEDQGRQETPTLERHLTALGTIASIAPFLGLLGTVLGFLRVFESLSEQAGATNAVLLSAGIHNALITTAAGLCVAIPTLVAYNYFTRRAESLILESERISLRLLNILKR